MTTASLDRAHPGEVSTTDSHTALPAQRLGIACLRLLRRVLEGPHDWGHYEASTSRSGATHFRLLIFPPGTNAAERRAFARARDWPLVGAIVALVWLSVAGDEVHPLVATVIALAVYTAGILATRWRTRAFRARVRRVHAVRFFDGVAMTTRGDLRLLQRAAVELHALDVDADSGELDRVAYEARWSAIYDRVDASQRQARNSWSLGESNP